MERRTFLSGLAASGAVASAAWKGGGSAPRRLTPAGGPVSKIGRYGLVELRDHFRRQLLDETIPLWDKSGVDREFGAYFRPEPVTGKISTTDKDLYSQGRILWLFSRFYNRYGRAARHLEAARQGCQALVEHARLPDGHWGTLYTRDWKTKSGFFDIYADIYMILGLQEYYRAGGDAAALRMAVETSYKACEAFLAPHYQGGGHGPAYEPGIKRLGTWVHFLYPVTLLLEQTRDEGLERLARMSVRRILRDHWRRDKGFAWECLDAGFEPYSDDYLSAIGGDDPQAFHHISGWHSIQGAFKVMLEALRVGSREMFREGLEFGWRTLELHWIDGPRGGLGNFAGEAALRRKEPQAPPPPYSLYDAFVFCLTAFEHTLAPEAAAWFDRAFTLAQGMPGGINNGSLTLHEPRGIMTCLEILDRMIARGGRASDFFSNAPGAPARG